MSRLTWFTAGTVTGVYLLVKARSTAWHFTPDGIAARAAAVAAGYHAFATQVGSGMRERETELRQRALDHPVLPVDVPAILPPPAEELADGHR
jgi:hypothetical protein